MSIFEFKLGNPLGSLERVILAAACDVHTAIHSIREDIRIYRQDTQRPWGIVQGEAVVLNNNLDPETAGQLLRYPWGVRVDFGHANNRNYTFPGNAKFCPQIEVLEFTFEFIGAPGYAIEDIRVGNASQMLNNGGAVIQGKIRREIKIGNEAQFFISKIF